MSWASDRVHGYRVHGLSLAPLNTLSPPRAGPWIPHSQAPGHALSKPPLRLFGVHTSQTSPEPAQLRGMPSRGWEPTACRQRKQSPALAWHQVSSPGTRGWTRRPAAQYGLGIRMTTGLTLAHGELAAGTWEDDEGDSQDFSACPAPSQRAPSQPGALGFGGGKTTNLTEA